MSDDYGESTRKSLDISSKATSRRLSPFSTKLPEDLQKSIKITCATTGIRMQDAVREAMITWLNSVNGSRSQ